MNGLPSTAPARLPSGLPSISDRIARSLLLWAVLWGAALALAAWLAVRHELDELLDDTLQAAAEGLAGPLVQDAATVVWAPAAAAPPASAPGAGSQHHSQRLVWQLVAHQGGAHVLRASAGAPAQALQATPSAGFADVPGWRVYGTPAGHDGQLLYVAQTREERQETESEVALAISLATLPMAALALLWLRMRVRSELLPLQALSLRLAGHDPLAPGASLGEAQRAELVPVHAAIDALAGGLARRMAHERAFTAHAAHALRTPLAGIDAQLAVALREAPAELQPRLLRVRAAAGRLQRVVAALLTLFRSGVELHRATLDLPALLARMPVAGLAVQVQATHAVDADADLLTAALLNLLDNAVRHGATGVVLTTPAPNALLMVDDGPGVDAQRRLELLRAIGTEDPESAVGLGLMLAGLVARAHGGALALPEVAHGFAVELRLGP